MQTLSNILARVSAPALVAALVGSSAVLAADPPPLRMPVPVVRTLPNGLRVVVLQVPRLPIVQLQLLVPAGVAQEAAGTPGAASATAQLLRAGTTSRSAAELAAEVDRLGGNLSGNAARDFSTVSGAFLAADFEAGLELLADVVVHPVFPPEEVARHRALTAVLVLPLRQDPAVTADERLWATVFEGHPYARSLAGSFESLRDLDAEAVQAFHRDFYRPDQAVLAIAGDVDPERAFAAAADRFGGWVGRAAPRPPAPPPVPRATPRIVVVDRPGQTRCEVRVGLIGPAQGSPDALALQLAERVLGSREISSRFARLLHAEGGLSADVRSSTVLQRDAGLVSLRATADVDSAAILIGRMRDELARMRTRPPDEAELAAARRYLQGSHALQLQTLGSVTAQWLGADLYGLPPATLERYPESVAAVSADQVAAAAARWLDPAHLVVVVVGPASALRDPLTPLGSVEIVASGAAGALAAGATPAPASPEQRARGRALLDQALAVHGGVERLRRVMDSTVDGSLVTQLRGNEFSIRMRQVRKEPWRLRYSTRIGSIENGQVLDGGRGWTYFSAGDSLRATSADAATIEALRAAFLADPVHSLLALADPSAEAVWRGAGRIDGRDADLVEVSVPVPAAGEAPTCRLLYLDAQDHHLMGEDLGDAQARSRPDAMHRGYRDFRREGGLLWPHEEEILRGGTMTMTVLVDNVTINGGVADALFVPPVGTEPSPSPR